MKRNLSFIVLAFSLILFFSKLGFAQVNEYSLDPVDLFITPNDSTIEVDIKINIIDTIWAFVVPLVVSGTSNPVLDTVLTGSHNRIDPPAFAPPSLVSTFTQRIVQETGSPMLFVAVDFGGGLIPPKTGLFCKMFFKVSGPGTLIFSTAVHPTAGSVHMNGPGGSKPINWYSAEEVGSFEVIYTTTGVWIHGRGATEMVLGDTSTYYIDFGNISNIKATQCTLSLHIPEHVHFVSASPPGIVADSTVTWYIDTLESQQFKKISVELTYDTLTYFRKTPWDIFEAIRLTVEISYVYGKAFYDWWVEGVGPFLDIFVEKDFPDQWDCNRGYPLYIDWGNKGIRKDAMDPIMIVDDIVLEHKNCVTVSYPCGGQVIEAENGWRIIWVYNSPLPGESRFSLTPWVQTGECPHEKVYNTLSINARNQDEEPRGDYYWRDRIIRNNKVVRTLDILCPGDPNQMVVSPEHYIGPGNELDYTIFFENEGGAPAESVRITSILDTSLADQTLDLLDTSIVYSAPFRKIIWDFPHMHLEPDSSGHVTYSIRSKDSLQSGTVIKGNAMVYFNYMSGVPCSVSVTVDALKPISRVDSVIWVSYPDTFKVFWSGHDPAPGSSGIMSYSIYCSVDGRPDSLWFADTAWFEGDTLKTSAIFVADSGHYYGFTSIAMDRVWNMEEMPSHPDVYFPFLRGDAYRDGKINVSDVIYIINYLFKGGPYPVPLEVADVNCDGKVNVADVIYLINYLFKGGPPLC